MTHKPQRNFSRRLFLTTGGMAATATAVGLGVTGNVLAQEATLAPPWYENWFETISVPAGRLRVARVPVDGDGAPRGKRVVIPLRLDTNHNASIDFIHPGTPVIRFGTATRQFTLTGDGITFPNSRIPSPWNRGSIRQLLSEFTGLLRTNPAEAAGLTQSLFSLRTVLDSAWFTAFREDDAWPLGGNEAAKLYADVEQRISRFADRLRPEGCRIETVVETVERQVIRQVEEVVQAAKRLRECLSGCQPWDVFCQGKCLAAQAFGTFSATVQIVETVIESVTKEVLVCPPKLPENFCPSPLSGLWEIPAEFRKRMVPQKVLQQIDKQMVSKVLHLLRGMTVEEFRTAFLASSGNATPPPSPPSSGEIGGLLTTLEAAIKKLPPVVKCVIFEGDWTLKALEDFGITTAGIRSIPYRVEVCVSSGCKQTIHAAGGPDALFLAVRLLIHLFDTVVPLVVFLTALDPSLGAVVGTILFLIIASLAELMLHLVATAGRIRWLEITGMLQSNQGICLIHPSIVPLSDLQELTFAEFLNLLLINGPPIPGPLVSPAPL